jgi:AmmeMemoRadiSam system protein B
MRNRNAVVEGRFYPAKRQLIFKQIEEIESAGRYPLPDLEPGKIFGAVLPHAGHVYSGYQTIPFFMMIKKLGRIPDTFVIIHPNHTGNGLPLAVDDSDTWSNSIGKVPLDQEIARAIDLPFDSKAHAYEHSAEVIVPFLQYYLADHSFSILPICMMDQSYSNAELVAGRIRHAAELVSRDVMLLASCDFSHFLSQEEGRTMDQQILDRVFERNPEGVERSVRDRHISICGYGPIMVLMLYAGSYQQDYSVEVLARGHSGEVIPSREVVDYISLIFFS